MKVEHLKNNRYTILVNGEYYATVNIDTSEIKDVPDDVSEEVLDEIYDAAHCFHVERLTSLAEEPDGYKKFGLSENEFIGI